MERADTTHQRTEDSHVWPLEEPLYLTDANFQIAFGIYSLSKQNGKVQGKIDLLDIEGYFELNLVQTSYNYGQNGIKYSNTPIETHQCNDEDQAKFSVDKDNIEEYFRIPSAQ